MPTASQWMKLALSLAQTARIHDEVPVGAIITHHDKVVATAFNTREMSKNACAHAEILAIQKACQKLGRWRLQDCCLYVTLEPCLMCAGAAWQARLPQVVFGASDPKGGAMGSLYQIHADERINHSIDVLSGVEETAAAEQLRSFFQMRRKQNKQKNIIKRQ